ncbi:MAG: sigma-70 family RNA polymerase sigma factor [Acidobacteria bacterium]|nr:sigma-70 family RNA polymerase sigma factor [Acidobacteriota bacterium]
MPNIALLPQPHSSGPSGTLETLFREHSEMVVQAAYRITGNLVDAEDVLQTVFLRLASREEKLDLSPNPKSYLYRAAINAALDIVRSRSGMSSLTLEDQVADMAADQRHNPEAQQADAELRRVVQAAVAQLGRTAAELFVLRFFEGYTNEEIGDLLGMSKLVVAVLVHRARASVKKEIKQYLETHHDTEKRHRGIIVR